MCLATSFFAERTVTGRACLDMLEELLMLILQEEGPNEMLYSKTGRLCIFSVKFDRFWMKGFQGVDWHGRRYRLATSPPPPFEGIHKICCLRDTVATVTPTMLTNVRTELQYRHDICHANHGAVIEHLKIGVQVTKRDHITHQNVSFSFPGLLFIK
jgi:hypothetical protein